MVAPMDRIVPGFEDRLAVYLSRAVPTPQQLHFDGTSNGILVFPWLDFDRFLSLMVLTPFGQICAKKWSVTHLRVLFKTYVTPVMTLMRKHAIDGPLVLCMSDNRSDYGFPTLVKSVGISPDRQARYVLPLNAPRHWRDVDAVARDDIAFLNKRDQLVWRGVTTGWRGHVGPMGCCRVDDPVRYHLAQQFEALQDYDIGFTEITQSVAEDPGMPLAQLQGMLRPALDLREQLQFRYLLSLEGNDVASGLKWMLHSNSTVLMPKPTCESWACESLLRPYVHQPLHVRRLQPTICEFLDPVG